MRTFPALTSIAVALGSSPMTAAQTAPSEMAVRVSEAQKANAGQPRQLSPLKGPTVKRRRTRRWPMKSRRPIVACVELLALSTLVTSPSSGQPARTDQDASSVAGQTYAYFAPAAPMDPARRSNTAVEAGEQGASVTLSASDAVGADLSSASEGAPRREGKARHIVAWLDLTEGPLVVSALDTGRHYVVPMLDRWTGVFAAVGARIVGTRADDFLVALPSWQGPLPAGVARIDSPTPYVWVISKFDTDIPPEADGVRRMPTRHKVGPLSEWARNPTPITIEIGSVLDMRTLSRTQLGMCRERSMSLTDQRC